MSQKVSKIIPPTMEEPSHTEDKLIRSSNSIYNRYIKRVLDFLIATVLIPLFLPFFLLISLAIILETGFPVFYCAPRGGYKEKAFMIFKFRSMVQDADKIGGGTTALNDVRITKVGKVLRRMKLDELPQFFNVWLGSMSFIGPRPELLQYTCQYKGLQKYILSVRPGITDYSSIAFVDLDEIVGAQDADMAYESLVLETKNKLRLQYIQTASFKTDAMLFCSTILRVLRKICRTTKPDAVDEKKLRGE